MRLWLSRPTGFGNTAVVVMSSAYGDGMPVRYQIRPLGDLPWPHGLGKAEYPELEWRMKRHLGNGYGSRAVHERALHCDPLYRMIAQDELSKLSWAADLLSAVDDVIAIASGSPLRGRTLEDVDDWRSWCWPVQESLSFSVYSWLSAPPRILPSKYEIGDGRHRLTYLRLHRGADHPVLVQEVY